MKYRIPLVFAILVIFLIASNPSEDEFRHYVKTSIIENSNDDAPFLNRIIGSMPNTSTNLLLNDLERSNYYLFSVFEGSVIGNEYKFLGISFMFFRI